MLFQKTVLCIKPVLCRCNAFAAARLSHYDKSLYFFAKTKAFVNNFVKKSLNETKKKLTLQDDIM